MGEEMTREAALHFGLVAVASAMHRNQQAANLDSAIMSVDERNVYHQETIALAAEARAWIALAEALGTEWIDGSPVQALQPDEVAAA